jgi:hypothetical protein
MIAFIPLVVLSVVSAVVSAPVPRALPTPVSVATAKTYLAALTVAVDSNSPAYSRDLFSTWDTSESEILCCSYTCSLVVNGSLGNL